MFLDFYVADSKTSTCDDMPFHENIVYHLANIQFYLNDESVGWITIMEKCDSDLRSRLRRGDLDLGAGMYIRSAKSAKQRKMRDFSFRSAKQRKISPKKFRKISAKLRAKAHFARKFHKIFIHSQSTKRNFHGFCAK